MFLQSLRVSQRSAPSEFAVPFFPVANYIALAALAGVIVLMAFDASTRIALVVGPLWYAILIAVYYARGMHKETRQSIRKASGE